MTAGRRARLLSPHDILGTVVRDDYDQPPPDVRAVVSVSDQSDISEVVAHCNWRPPYVREPGADGGVG